MKTYFAIVSLVFLCGFFVACQKSGVNPSSSGRAYDIIDMVSTTPLVVIDPALVGDWQVVSDSSSSYSQAYGSHGKKYIGTATDRFTFTSGGTAYINEQAVLDTGSYSVNPDRSIEIVYPSRVIAGVKLGNSADYFKISSLDTHNVVLSDQGWSPGGVYFVRIVMLKK
ncbi:MAG: hypothetical protein ACXVAU_06050 [Mucilaginibacter sp.]